MRVITNKNVQYLAVHMSQIPGLEPEAVVFVIKTVAKDGIGIMGDKKSVFGHCSCIPCSFDKGTYICI